jgi:hypothetical protein
MRRTFRALAVAGVAALSTVVFGQTTPDFSGTWTFNEEKSQATIAFAGPTASSALVITQTPAQLRIETAALLQDSQATVYKLDGTEATTTTANGSTTTSAKWNGASLVPTTKRRYGGPQGDITIDTTDLNGKPWLDMAGNFYSENAHIVERLRLIDANTIAYRATIEDPTVFARPWTIEMPLPRSEERATRSSSQPVTRKIATSNT